MRAPSARPENQTNKTRGGRLREGGTTEVIAASGFACSGETSGGAWKVRGKTGGAALPLQQLAQAVHFACDEAGAFEHDLPQSSPVLCSAV